MSVRDDLHAEVDELSEQDIERVLLMVRRLRTVAAWQSAPPDDEETEEDAQAVAEARADVAAGRIVPWDDVKRKWHELDR